MKKEFLDLGKQPIANRFLENNTLTDEFLFDLKVTFDDETKLVSLKDFVEPEEMFNENYTYHSSTSYPMKEHFKKTAEKLLSEYNPINVMEIGSNDGIFIRHFNPDTTFAVEPCGNFADITNDMEYKTYPEFWTTNLSELIKQNHGTMDLIYSANCVCHIQDLDDAFTAVKNLLSEDGIFVFEDPSLINMMQRGSYDQIYDEHAHIFSVTALNNLLNSNGLSLFKVDNLSVHGGSNRIYAKLNSNKNIKIDKSVEINLTKESEYGLLNIDAYNNFSKKVKKSKKDLVSMLKAFKLEGKKIVSYGATSKSTTVFNYCGIDSSLIDYIVDTTLDKQGKYQPGTRIPVISPEDGFNDSVDISYLGAWNFKDVIIDKEKDYINRGGKFITHIPNVKII